jgi:hypothetical protein
MNAPFITGFAGDAAPLLGASLAVRTLVEYLVLGGAVLLVTGLAVVWLAFFRKPRRHSHRHRRHHRTTTESTRSDPSGPTATASSQGERRRRNPRQRPPTLAETGGLPPPRDAQPRPSEYQSH